MSSPSFFPPSDVVSAKPAPLKLSQNRFDLRNRYAPAIIPAFLRSAFWIVQTVEPMPPPPLNTAALSMIRARRLSSLAVLSPLFPLKNRWKTPRQLLDTFPLAAQFLPSRPMFCPSGQEPTPFSSLQPVSEANQPP